MIPEHVIDIATSNIGLPLNAFWKRALRFLIYEDLFSKTRSPNLVLTFETHFCEWRATRFGKELFIHDSELDCVPLSAVF